MSDHLYEKGTPSKINSTFAITNMSPPKQANRGNVGNTVAQHAIELNVMCWNLCDFGSGFNAWVPLPPKSYEGKGEKFEAWIKRHLELTSENVGKSRGDALDDSAQVKLWSRWRRLADLAEHIMACDADVTVLLEIMTRHKGNAVQVNCWKRVDWEKAICIAEGFELPIDAQAIRAFFLQYDKGITQEYKLEYQNDLLETAEGGGDDDEEVDDEEARLPPDQFWTSELAEVAKFATEKGAAWRKQGQKGTFEELQTAVEADEDCEDYEDLVPFLQELINHAAESNGASMKDADKADGKALKYGEALLESLNEVLSILDKEKKWIFIPGKNSAGETIAMCARKGWTMEGAPVPVLADGIRRPLYKCKLENAQTGVVIYAGHAPAPKHLRGKGTANSASWYDKYAEELRRARAEDDKSSLHILCGDFNLDIDNKPAKRLHASFFKGMYPDPKSHCKLKSSFKGEPKKKKSVNVDITTDPMNAAYDKVLLVGAPPQGAACVHMEVGKTWKSYRAGRRYSDHAWVQGRFIYLQNPFVQNPLDGYSPWISSQPSQIASASAATQPASQIILSSTPNPTPLMDPDANPISKKSRSKTTRQVSDSQTSTQDKSTNTEKTDKK
jgi:hypothetical protein